MQNERYTIILMHEAVSPITHMEGTSGNVATLMRQSVIHDGEADRVPCLTGNALRNRLLREPSAHILKARLGLYGHLSTHQDRFLTSGQERSVKGNSLDAGLLRRGFELHPHVRVLGGTLPSEVVSGRSSVGFGVLVCRETAREQQAIIPRAWWPDGHGPLLSYQSMVELRQYTRRSDDTETPLREGEKRERDMMIYATYTVASGATYLQRINLEACRAIDAGMACAAIEMWDGTIGGQKQRGHGRLETRYVVLKNGVFVDAASLIEAYMNHIEDHKQAMIDWIFEAVGESTPKELADAAA